MQISSIFVLVLTINHLAVHSESDCTGPKMTLTSDNPPHTCTQIEASSNRIEYSCDSLIESFEKPLITYCPVETCLPNGTWTKPSISCAMTECYVQGFSFHYIGNRVCTVSGRPCQRWDKQEPHRHRFKNSDMFPDFSISLAESFCRDPNGSKGSPWCLTMDPDKKWEFCAIKMCSLLEVHDRFCGPPRFGIDEIDWDYTDTSPTYDTIRTEKTVTPWGPTTGQPTTIKYSDVDLSTTLKTNDADSQLKSTCENGVIFKTMKNTSLKGKPFLKVATRSMLECSTLCATCIPCQSFVYGYEWGSCHLYDGDNLKEKREKGVMMGMKICTT